MKGFAMIRIGEVGWIELDKPTADPLGAVVRPLVVSSCTSDTHTVWSGAMGERHNIVMGHEAVGEVVQVGSLVRDFRPGDRVIVPAVTPDWGSTESQSGFPMHSGGMLGGWKFTNRKHGVFAEYFHVNEADANLARLPPGVGADVAVMLCDMAVTGFHGVELAGVGFGDTVAVFGIGPVGLMSVAGSALRGAARILAVGSRPRCVEVAERYGATDVIDYKRCTGDQLVERILDATAGRGVDRVIIAGGNVDTFAQAVRVVKPGGCIGNVNYLDEGSCVGIPRVEWGVGMGHKRIDGGLTPGGRLWMERLGRLLQYGRLDTSPLITHRFAGLEGVEAALMLMKDKPADLIKPIVVIDE